MKPSDLLTLDHEFFRRTKIMFGVSLAIARIFGGFPPSFFTTYHTYLPKSEPVDQYPYRMDLYELFHYLNHTVLFGVRLT